MNYIDNFVFSYNRLFESNEFINEEELLDKFIHQVSSLFRLDEDEDGKHQIITKEELEKFKNEINTPEDMEKYIQDNKENIQKFLDKCKENNQSKLAKFFKYTFKILWSILKYGIPFTWKNKGTIMILFLYFVICGKLGMSPWTSAGTLFDATWETGKTVVDAAIKINNGVDSYLEGSEKVGEKIGSVIGTTVEKMKNLFN